MTNNTNYNNFLLSLVIFSTLLVGFSYTTGARANASNLPQATKTMDLAYFRVYRLRPEWRYHGPGYYRCKRECHMNQYGITTRCVRRCHPGFSHRSARARTENLSKIVDQPSSTLDD